jgi:putative tricarboxylic transport membrane protein
MEKLKADPQSLNVAIGIAVGGTNHLSIALVMKAMGVDARKLKTVVFQSNAQNITAVMGGHVDLTPLSLATALNAAEQGRLRILGVSTERRGDGALAEVPTWKEQGFNVVFANTRFLVGPKGMSPAQTAYWDGALERLVQHEDWKSEVAKNHWTQDYVSSKQSGQRMAGIYAQLKEALTDVGLAKE